MSGLRVNYSVNIENCFSYTCYQIRIFHSKFVIIIALCLYLENNNFHLSLLSVFKMNDTFNFEDKFLYIFIGYQTRFFHSKSLILIVLCLVLTNSLFQQNLLRGLSLNYSVTIENYFSYTFSCYLRDPKC